MNDYLRGQLEAYCYMVKRGKPAASLPIQKRYVSEAEQIITEKQLRSYTTNLDEEWSELWVYEYNHILVVIKRLELIEESAFKHWVLGKLFNYDESSIEDFLEDMKCKNRAIYFELSNQ